MKVTNNLPVFSRLLRKYSVFYANSGVLSFISKVPLSGPSLIRRVSSFAKENGCTLSACIRQTSKVVNVTKSDSTDTTVVAPPRLVRSKPVIRVPLAMVTMPPVFYIEPKVFEDLKPYLARHEIRNYVQYGVAPVPYLIKDRFVSINPEVLHSVHVLKSFPTRGNLRRIRGLVRADRAWTRLKGRKGTIPPTPLTRLRRLIFAWLRHLRQMMLEEVEWRARFGTRGFVGSNQLLDQIASLRERLKSALSFDRVKQLELIPLMSELARGIMDYSPAAIAR